MQISSSALFVFVEGKRSDRYFYGRIAANACSASSLGYTLIAAAELPAGAGGKQALLQFQRFLGLSGALMSEFKGKKTGAIFFLDKDVDDLLHLTVASPHVVYTKAYDVEGHIFAEGDLVAASAALAGLDEQEVRRAFGDGADWRRLCAEKWKEWIKICLFCKKHAIPNCANFRVVSQINTPPTGPVDNNKSVAYLALVENRSGLNSTKFRRAYEASSRIVERLFSTQASHVIFKGKWYAAFVAAEIHAVAAGRPINLPAVHSGVAGATSTTVDYNGPWSDHFLTPLRALVEQLI